MGLILRTIVREHSLMLYPEMQFKIVLHNWEFSVNLLNKPKP